MLLYQLSPTSKFSEQERDVRNGATVFTLTVDFMGQVFYGSGKSCITFSQEAKEAAADKEKIVLFIYFCSN